MHPLDASIYLLRHGEAANPDHVVYADLPGFPLSRAGREQAGAAAIRLIGRQIAAIVTSPLARAVETSFVVGDTVGAEVVIDEDLTEWGLGARWAGTRWEDLPVRFPGELEAYLHHPHDLHFSPESLDALADRMVQAVELRRAQVRGPLVFVSHQDPIQAARLRLVHRDLSRLHENKPGHASIIELAAGAPARPWSERWTWTPDQTVAGRSLDSG